MRSIPLPENIGYLNTMVKEYSDLIIGIGFYIITAFLDTVCTIHGMQTGLQEGNPIPRYFMDMLGIEPGLFFVKGFVGMFLMLFCGRIRFMADRYVRCLPFYIISIAQTAAAAAWIVCLHDPV